MDAQAEELDDWDDGEEDVAWQSDQSGRGEFTLSRRGRAIVARYRLSSAAREAARALGVSRLRSRRTIELLRFDSQADSLTILPKFTFLDRDDFGDDRYRIKRITLKNFGIDPPSDGDDVYELLEQLPKGFSRFPDSGLGLKKKYERLLGPFEKLGITELVIDHQAGWALAGKTFTVPASIFDQARRGIDRIHRNALAEAAIDKTIFANNSLLSALDNQRFPEKSRPYKPDTVFKAVGQMAPRQQLSPQDQQVAVRLIEKSARAIAQREPEALVELDRKLKSVTLGELIKEMEPLLAGNAKEDRWQRFLRERPFALYLAFGVPVTMIGEQVSVGGTRFDGTGERKADFLLRAGQSGNLALVEIKTHRTPLLGRTYRASGAVKGPSSELAGAVAQVQDQRYIMGRDFLSRFQGASIGKPYTPHCLVIAGLSPRVEEDKKSFELYRNGLLGVSVVTFDELLEKLISLRAFLRM